jgi:hypothetical protein
MSRTLCRYCTGEVGFNFFLGSAAILRTELHTDTGSTGPLCPFGRNPDDLAGDRNFFRFTLLLVGMNSPPFLTNGI